jgi:ribonucleoside-diphosphate reductase alpha chain
MSSKVFEEYMQTTNDFINGVIEKKYLLNDEKTYEDIINIRFKNKLSKISNSPSKVSYLINSFLDKRLIPAGSIISGLGNENFKCSLSNCYHIPIEEDSIEGIYECQKKLARTFSHRGGSGTSVTILRPKNAPVNNSAKTSTGAVSFMPGFSLLAHDIGQSGRRAALIITIDCRHPDVLDFIWSKAKPDSVFEKDSLTNFQPDISYANISVFLTNDFMEAVKNDADWDLFFPDTTFENYNKEWDGDYDKWLQKGYPTIHYKTINARDMLNQISEACWLTGDPGVGFIDNVKNFSTGLFDSKLTPINYNPCGEQTLPNFGNCLLGCSALHKYIINPYTINAEFDINTFLIDIEHLVYFLDLMIDINIHPLKEQNELDHYSRRIGVEVTGLNDMWAMLNMDYGSEKACEFIDDIMFAKAVCEIKTSIQLAKEKGHAPCFKTKSSRKKFIEQPYIQRILDKLLKTNRKEIENDILNYGLRNSAFNTMGPTGTISIIADNCTSGGEPIYDISYKRESRLFPDKKINMVHLPLVKHVGESILEMEKDEIKKKYHYTAAHDINYHTRIKVQSILQKWTDNSISSTINLKNDTKIKDIFDIYVEAYENNLKGVTIFRDGCKKGILSSDNESNLNELSKPKEIVTTQMIKQHIELVKPEYEKTLRGYRNLKYWQKNKIYLMVNVDNEGKPKEIFAKIPNKLGQINDIFNQQVLNEKKSYWESTCRLVSLLLRINTPIELIINQLQKSSPTINEVPNIISQVLKKYISYDKETIEKITKEKTGGEFCSICQSESIIYQGGCSTCLNCGDSKCG